MLMPDQKTAIETAIERMYSDPHNNCIVCGNKSDLVGAFETQDPVFLCPDNKLRVILYHICSECRASVGIEALVEELLKRRMLNGTN
jgi:hypothetical protein